MTTPAGTPPFVPQTVAPEDVQRYRDLANGASPGPWEQHRKREDGSPSASVYAGRVSCNVATAADAAFIAAARTAVPMLCDEADRLWTALMAIEPLYGKLGEAMAEIDRLRAALARLVALCREHRHMHGTDFDAAVEAIAREGLNDGGCAG